MSKLLRDRDGSSLIEFTLVFPLFMLVVFGTIDVTYMLYEWSLANKAVYYGARTAIVSSPVASGLTNPTYDPLLMGDLCFTTSTGATNGNCASTSAVCTPDAGTGGSCTNGFTFDNSPFADPTNANNILGRMQAVFPRLQRQNVEIGYQTTGLGFVGRPGGLPMTVTVKIRCMTHAFFFIGALMRWVFPALPGGCPTAPAGPAMPDFSTTLPSESMGATGS